MIRQVVFIIAFILSMQSIFGQVGIGTTQPNEAAVLDVSSVDKGILTPRLTNAQRDAVSNPAKGLVIYNLTEDCLQINSGNAISPNWDCIGVGVDDNSIGNSTVVISDCIGFVGDYFHGVPTDTFVYPERFYIELTNNGFTTASFSNLNLLISGDSAGIRDILGPAPGNSFTIAPGASQEVFYGFVGTLQNLGGTIHADWRTLGLRCTDSVNITTPVGDAIFNMPESIGVVSVNDTYDGTLIDVQGVIDNGANKIEVRIPYSSGTGSYAPYNGTFEVGTGVGGETNSFRISYPGGHFIDNGPMAISPSDSGYIAVTIEVDGDGTFNALKQPLGVSSLIAELDFQVNGVSKGTIDLVSVGGIPDKNFSLYPDHRFVYLPITTTSDGIWLSHNLGAAYANVNGVDFDFTQEAIAHDDHRAYGSLFQWGRQGRGHELRFYNSPTHVELGEDLLVQTIGTTLFEQPSINLRHVIHPQTSPFDWLEFPNDNLWASESAANNPCPDGFRLPTEQELLDLFTNENITDDASAASAPVKFTTSGYSDFDIGPVTSVLDSVDVGVTGRYWTSTVSGSSARMVYITSGGVGADDQYRALGANVRCKKD